MGIINLEEGSYDDINTAFNNLYNFNNTTFKPLVLSVINILLDNKKRPDIDSIRNHIIKTQASNADRVLIESVVTNLMKEKLIINKKDCFPFRFLLLKQCHPERRNYA